MLETREKGGNMWKEMHSRRRARRTKRLVGIVVFFAVCVCIGLYFRESIPDVTKFGAEYIPDFLAATHVQLPMGNTILDPTRVALIMETRAISHLPALILHFISVLPFEWVVKVVGTPEALGVVSASVAASRFIESGKLVLVQLPQQYPIDNAEMVSATLTDITFYREFLAPAEWLLVFQGDSMICAASEFSLNDWVDQGFTYIGAPWNLGNQTGGNGGLSLRHVPEIVELLQTKKREPNDEMWEDRWLSDNLASVPGANMPGPEIERYFSVESVWTEWPFGYHLRGSGVLLDPEIWSNETRKREVFEYCPEIKIVMDMDLVGSRGRVADKPSEQVVKQATEQTSEKPLEKASG